MDLARGAAPLRAEIGWINAVASTSGSGPLSRSRPVRRRLPAYRSGYDAAMSESSNETESTTGSSSSDEQQDTAGMITDDQLPDDLNPEKNPLAAEPDEDEDTGLSAPNAAGDGQDLGQPG